jgi:hypothetical protein
MCPYVLTQRDIYYTNGSHFLKSAAELEMLWRKQNGYERVLKDARTRYRRRNVSNFSQSIGSRAIQGVFLASSFGGKHDWNGISFCSLGHSGSVMPL